MKITEYTTLSDIILDRRKNGTKKYSFGFFNKINLYCFHNTYFYSHHLPYVIENQKKETETLFTSEDDAIKCFLDAVKRKRERSFINKFLNFITLNV